LLGKALTTDLDEGWEIARHLADYVLIWGGGGGDDLAKSPHLARIANSVYRNHCPDDPTCRAFGFIDRQGTPSVMMRRSLLYGLHGHGLRPEVNVSVDRFQEVYRSKYGKVRIYKIVGVSEESKQWVLDNRKCDAPGSWFCPGQYPPGLKPFIDAKTDFRQLEDFNRGGQADEEYQKQYFKDLQNPESARKKMMEKEYREQMKQKEKQMTETEKQEQARKKEILYSTWEDSESA
jgi:dolichyl-diphosphooligosaccharide---protein glycosyltransferase